MNFRSVVVGLVAAAGAAVISPGVASAMPNGLPHADTVTTSPAVQVRWVCNPWGRCWWRPNYYGAYGYGPRLYGPRFYGGYGHRGWRRW